MVTTLTMGRPRQWGQLSIAHAHAFESKYLSPLANVVTADADSEIEILG